MISTLERLFPFQNCCFEIRILIEKNKLAQDLNERLKLEDFVTTTKMLLLLWHSFQKWDQCSLARFGISRMARSRMSSFTVSPFWPLKVNRSSDSSRNEPPLKLIRPSIVGSWADGAGALFKVDMAALLDTVVWADRAAWAGRACWADKTVWAWRAVWPDKRGWEERTGATGIEVDRVGAAAKPAVAVRADWAPPLKMICVGWDVTGWAMKNGPPFPVVKNWDPNAWSPGLVRKSGCWAGMETRRGCWNAEADWFIR